ncbi:hypothetical protein KM043_017323 [Ampulex compressa]|nr:hypothetical protein KM043_017323 [Ampulex compressa]
MPPTDGGSRTRESISGNQPPGLAFCSLRKEEGKYWKLPSAGNYTSSVNRMPARRGRRLEAKRIWSKKEGDESIEKGEEGAGRREREKKSWLPEMFEFLPGQNKKKMSAALPMPLFAMEPAAGCNLSAIAAGAQPTVFLEPPVR